MREPLSNISRRATHIVETSHYATVSDDSDETYEAIEEPVQVYTSGSETYAKIAPIARPEPTSPHQLPSVTSTSTSLLSLASSTVCTQQRAHSPLIHATADIRTATSPKLHLNTNVHSRQSSNSSQVSTDQQRRNNSPLPKTPEIIDNMYAKVMKMNNKFKGGRQRTDSIWSSSSYEDQVRFNASDRNSVEFLPPGNTKPSTADPYESFTRSPVGYEQINQQRSSIVDVDDIDPNYEKIHRKTNNKGDIGYAQINQHQRSNSEAKYDNGYEQIHKTSPNEDLEANYDFRYEKIHHNSRPRHSSSRMEDNNYERIHREDRDSSNYDVGYEQIHKANNSDMDSIYDIRYEKIHGKNLTAIENIPDDEDDDDPNYEELKSSARESNVNDEFDDPNYEVLSTVVRRAEAAATNEPLIEHNYASINKYNKKKYRQSEPNFPSAMKKFENNNESTYECMNDCFDSNPENVSHKRSNSVSRIEVEPNVFYSQVQKTKR